MTSLRDRTWRPPAAASFRPRSQAGRHETLIFRGAVAIVALAVVDDAFLHPEPGTSAADHLVSGLVPVALAVALALVYPRLRAGARAAVAFVCGVLALTAGVADGWRHAFVDRLGGDDVTAMLAAVAGIALLALAPVILWRARRRDERQYRRRAATLFGGIGCLLLAIAVAFAIVATHRAREPVAAVDLGRAFERVAFTTSDGLRLAGSYVPSRNGAAVILSPGRSAPAAHARLLVRHGYGVLLFDRRGEGESEGDFNAFGWGGDADIKAAAAFLRERPDVRPDAIGGLGLSVGGEMMLEAAAENSTLRAVVSEGAGARSLAEHLDDPGPPAALRPLSHWVPLTAALTVLSGRMPPPSLTDLVDGIAPRPVLLIRGLAGQEQEAINRAYLANARPPKALWEVPQAGHTAALSAAPAEYERRVVGFFDRALAPE